MNPLKWLLTKHQKEASVTDITASDDTQATAVAVEEPITTTVDTTPMVEVKAGVKDFEAALAFVESGVSQLGEAAKDELKALAVKYL